MVKKYKLTSEKMTIMTGVVLHRIQATRDFGDVKKGELGGWIEKKGNLSQYDICWVYDNAKVYGRARVFGNARVEGNARVYGNALICEEACVATDAMVYGKAQITGNGWIFGSAQVCGDAHIHGHTRIRYDIWDKTPLQIQGSLFYVNMYSLYLRIGCEKHTIPEWLENYREIAAENGITEESVIEEYYGYIKQFAEIYCPEALKGQPDEQA